MAFGIRSVVAHRVVGIVMGPRTIQHETIVNEVVVAAPAPTTNAFCGDACNLHIKAFQNGSKFLLMLLILHTLKLLKTLRDVSQVDTFHSLEEGFSLLIPPTQHEEEKKTQVKEELERDFKRFYE
ncbi:hypothetical protein Fmac_014839 [Flemingia macrophylla]|uniref:Uncharacterized protein n=1 Tax=Flemingia macrophylla TaxID=520843 RepID=A0ABD1MCU5_9FABA